MFSHTPFYGPTRAHRRATPLLALVVVALLAACNLTQPASLADGAEPPPQPPPVDDGAPGAGPGAREPAGMVRIYETDFNSETPLVGTSTHWAYNAYGSLVRGADGASGGAFRTLFPTGLTGGSYPTITRFWASAPEDPPSAPKYQVAYTRFRLKIEGTDFQVGSTATKLFYWGYGRTRNDNDAFLTLAGSGMHDDMVARAAFGLRMYISEGDAGSGTTDLHPGVPHDQNVDARALVTVGAWHDIEVLFDVGQVDGRNGSAIVWVDGTKVIDVSGLPVRNSSDDALGDPAPSTNALFNMSWVPVFTSSADRTRDDSLLLDRVYVSVRD